MLQVEVKIAAAEPTILNALYAAFKPESEPMPRYRSRVEVARESSLTLRVTIRSGDISSLRASVNMVLRILGAICASTEVVSQPRSCSQSEL